MSDKLVIRVTLPDGEVKKHDFDTYSDVTQAVAVYLADRGMDVTAVTLSEPSGDADE